MPEHPEYQVYMLANLEGKFYIGISKDPQSRLAQHNRGESTWTEHRGPWRIIWSCGELSYCEARKLESKLKRQKGGDGFYKMLSLPR